MAVAVTKASTKALLKHIGKLAQEEKTVERNAIVVLEESLKALLQHTGMAAQEERTGKGVAKAPSMKTVSQHIGQSVLTGFSDFIRRLKEFVFIAKNVPNPS